MSTRFATMPLQDKPIQEGNVLFRIALFALLLTVGLAVYVFGCNFYVIFPTNQNLAYNLLLSAGLLAAALWFRRDERWNKYWQITFAFFIGSFVFPLTLVTAEWKDVVLGWLNLTINSSQGLAVDKVMQAAITIASILLLTKLSGADLRSVYIQRGNLKLGLGIGALVFFNFAASAFLFFALRYTDVNKLAAAAAWGLVFAFANGFLEELWLRGIFLKRLQPLLGMGSAILLTSLVFALMHGGATYLTPVALPFMVMNTLTLGIACGYLMIKTDNIWGPTLIHAAADFFLFFAMLASA